MRASRSMASCRGGRRTNCAWRHATAQRNSSIWSLPMVTRLYARSSRLPGDCATLIARCSPGQVPLAPQLPDRPGNPRQFRKSENPHMPFRERLSIVRGMAHCFSLGSSCSEGDCARQERHFFRSGAGDGSRAWRGSVRCDRGPDCARIRCRRPRSSRLPRRPAPRSRRAWWIS